MPTYTTYDDFVNEIRSEVVRCPEPHIEDTVQRVIVEFFEKTEAWQVDLDPLWPIENENEYALSGAVSGVSGAPGGLPWRGNTNYELEDRIQGSSGSLAYALECIAAGISDDTQDVSTAWVASTGYNVGDQIGITGGTEYLFECVAAGTSGTTEPTWPTDDLAGVLDGTVGWQNKGLNYTEPTWPATEAEAVVDGAVIWQNMGRVTAVPAGVTVVSIKEIKRNGREMNPNVDFRFDPRTLILTFFTDPTVTDEYRIKVVVKPKYGKTLIPDVLMEQYLTYIKAGILYRLLLEPDQFWTNMNLGGLKKREWLRGIGAVRNRMVTGNTGQQTAAQPRKFGFL